jgi:DNA helicase HerA-like ATPase
MSEIQANLIMKTPSEVFTPRAGKVNSQMYVQRAELELQLNNALGESKHIIIHGESGSGKTWLYKSVLASKNSVFAVADLANANRFGSIGAELKELVAAKGEPTLEGFTEKKAAEVNTRPRRRGHPLRLTEARSAAFPERGSVSRSNVRTCQLASI